MTQKSIPQRARVGEQHIFFANVITVNCSFKKVLHHMKSFVQPDVREILRGLKCLWQLMKIISTTGETSA